MLAILLVSSYWAIRLGWADHLSHGVAIAERERAAQLAPLLAPYAERLALRRRELGADPQSAWRQALELDPENPDRWIDLALAAEWSGDAALAERSLLGAAARSRLYRPRYLLAQHYFRAGTDVPFWRWARAALEVCPGDCAPIFELAWRIRPDTDWLHRNLLPPRREIRQEYLAFLTVRGHWEAASHAAQSLAETATTADVTPLVEYCDAALAAGVAQGPAAVWQILGRRGLLPGLASDRDSGDAAGNRIANGGVGREPLKVRKNVELEAGAGGTACPTKAGKLQLFSAASGGGFDWRLAGKHFAAAPGITVDAERGQLRMSFSGRQPERCPLAWQYLRLQPGQRYRVRCAMSDSPGAADAWIAAVITGATAEAACACGSGARSASFTAVAEVGRVSLIYQRPPGSARAEGTVSVAKVSLEVEQ